MTGLRSRVRDADLPARAGEPELVPPDPSTVGYWVAAHLLGPGAPPVATVRWDYARWKPGVSLTSMFSVELERGEPLVVVAKRYRDGKDRELMREGGTAPEDPAATETTALRRTRAHLAQERLVLFLAQADRILTGQSRLLDRRLFSRALIEGGLLPDGAVRKRRVRYELLRYKPERRAVYRVAVPLRGQDAERHDFAVRLHPPQRSARQLRTRRRYEACGGEALTPPVALGVAEHGWVLEPWLAVKPRGPDDFAHAPAAGAALARLHATPLADDGEPARRVRPSNPLRAFVALDERLVRSSERAPTPTEHRSAWCHGDFHPDQVARGVDGATWLLDLDLLHLGDPARDLASWIADGLLESGEADLERWAGPLLDGYRRAGGAIPPGDHLRVCVASALLERAAGGLRRLEEGSVERAAWLVATAQDLAPASH